MKYSGLPSNYMACMVYRSISLLGRRHNPAVKVAIEMHLGNSYISIYYLHIVPTGQLLFRGTAFPFNVELTRISWAINTIDLISVSTGDSNTNLLLKSTPRLQQGIDYGSNSDERQPPQRPMARLCSRRRSSSQGQGVDVDVKSRSSPAKLTG